MNLYLLDPILLKPNVTYIQRASFIELVDFARKDRYGKHSLTDFPERADFILAPIMGNTYDVFFRELRRSQFYRTHQEKVYVYCGDDNAYPSLPGIYPSLTREWVLRKWAAGGHYVSAHLHKHAFELPEKEDNRDLLFSFIGSSRTHAVRAEVIRLQHPVGLIFDANPKNDEGPWYQKTEDETHNLFRRYKAIMQRTKFALCPRGVSPSSIRLFEAMEAGCVPVIIADQLVLPQGPNWSSFSIRVLEKNISSIPEMLEELEPKFPEMSRAARVAWEDYFSPQSTFNSLVEWIVDLNESMPPKRRKLLELAVVAGEYLRPTNMRTRMRRLLRRG